MTPLNHAIDPNAITERIKVLPRDHRGFPIPWFVYFDAMGMHDFRVIGPGKIACAIAERRCFICGQPLARDMAFNIGPMTSINRMTSEPPSHRHCALFAATYCPFLSRPNMRRNSKALPSGAVAPAGAPAMHNPGATCVWVTREYKLVHVDNGTLFRIGEPVEVRWLCEGRAATRDDVVRAIEKGLPILLDEAREQGEDSVTLLLQAVQRMRQYLPTTREGNHHVQKQGAPPTSGSSGVKPRATRARS